MKQRKPLSKSNSLTSEHVRFKEDMNEYENNSATKQITAKDKVKSIISGETLLPRTPLVKGKTDSEIIQVENTESHHIVSTENKTQFNDTKRNSYYDLFNIILCLQNNVKMKLKIGIASGTPGEDTFSMFKATKKLLVRFNWNDCADPELEWGIQFFEMNPNDHDKFNKLYKAHLFADIAEDVFLEPQPANAFRLYRGKEALHLTVKEPGSAYAWADAVFAAMQLLGRNADELCHFRHLFEEEHNVQSSHIEVTRSRSLSGGSSSSRDQGDLSPRSPLSSPRGQILSDEEVSGEHKESSPRIDTAYITSGEAHQRQDEEQDEQNEDEDREGSVVSTMSVTAAKKKKGMFKKVAKLFATRSAKDTHDHPTGGESPAKSPSFVSGARNAFRRMSSLGSIAEHSPRKRTTSDESEQPVSTTATSNAKAHHPPLPPAGFLSQSLMSSSPMSRRASMQSTPAAEREEKEDSANADDGLTAASNSELGSLHYKRTVEGIALGSAETEGTALLRSFSPFQPPPPPHPQPHSQPQQPSHIPTTAPPSSSAPANKVVLRDADKQLLESHLQKRLSLRPIDTRPVESTSSPVASPEGKTKPSSKSPKKSPGSKQTVTAHRVVLPEGVTVLPRRTVLDRLYRESLMCDGVQQRPNPNKQQQSLYSAEEESSPKHFSATEAVVTSMSSDIKSPKSVGITTYSGNELEACRLLLQRDEYYLPQCIRDAERSAVTSSSVGSVGSGFGSQEQEEFDYDSALSRYYYMSSNGNSNDSNNSGKVGAAGKVVGLYHPIMQVLSLKKQPQKQHHQQQSSTSTSGGGAAPGDDEEPTPVRQHQQQQQHSFMHSTIDRSVPLATRLKNQISFPAAQTAATPSAPIHTTDAPSHTKVSASHNLSLSERLAQTKSPAARKWTGGAANEYNSSVGASQSREQKLLSLLTSPKSSSHPSDEVFSIFAADRYVSNASHSTPARSQLRTGKSSLEAERRPRAVSFSSVEDAHHSASDSEGRAETDLSEAEQRQQKISGRSRSSEDGASSVHSHGSSNHSNHSAEGTSHSATAAVSALKAVDVDLGKPFTRPLISPLMPGATSTHSQQQTSLLQHSDIHPRSAGRRNLVTALAAVSTELTPPKSAKQSNGVQSMQPTTLLPDYQQTQTALSALTAAEDSGASSSLDSPILVAQFSKHSVLLRVVSESDLRTRGHLVHCLDLVDLRQTQRRQRLRGGEEVRREKKVKEGEEESEEALYLSVSSALHCDALHIPLSDVITADIDANGTGLFRLCVTRYFDHAYYYPQVVNGAVVDPQQKGAAGWTGGAAPAGSIFASTLRGTESATGEDLSSPLCLVFKAVKPATPNDWLESLFAYKEISDL